MARVGYRAISDRFTHIDAKLLEARVQFPDGTGILRVRFYPWWEHPDYIAAIESGSPWGFRDTTSGEIEVTVYPSRMIAARLSGTSEVIDWSFLEEHELLWPYEDAAMVYCNSSLDEETWARLDAAIRRRLPRLPPRGAPLVARVLGVPSFALGTLPFTLFRAATAALDELGLAWFCARPPVEKKLPKLLLLDGEDYIIADDFEVDVPEIRHEKGWFAPPPRR